MDDVGRYLAGLFELITRAYRLDPAALAWVRDQPYSIGLTAGVALLAGISVMLGHAVVLLLNRITGWRFAIGLLVSAVWLVLLHALESVVLWALGSWASGQPVPYLTVLTGVLVSTAPQIWGFLVLIPTWAPRSDGSCRPGARCACGRSPQAPSRSDDGPPWGWSRSPGW